MNAAVVERLTSDKHAAAQRRRILLGSSETTHVSCVDAEGYAVALTSSMGYGSGITIPGTSILMNNALGEPELNPAGFHSLKPGERLNSSMAPTIVASRDGDLLYLGSSGSSRIPTALLQTLVGVLDAGLTLEAAVAAPRFHAETVSGRSLFAHEPGARKADLRSYDEVLAYEEPFMFFGGVNAVRRSAGGTFDAAADPRRSGTIVEV